MFSKFESIIEYKFGIDFKKIHQLYSTINDLKLNKDSFAFINCKINKDFSIFVQNEEKILKKDVEYIMPISSLLDLYNENEKALDLFEKSFKKFSEIYKHYEGEDLNNKTLFVWRSGGIGDLLFIQPSLIDLKKRYPTCKIWFGTIKDNFPLIKDWDFIDKKIEIPFETEYLYKANYHCTFQGVIEKTKQAEKTNAYELFNKWMGLNTDINNLRPILKVDKKINKQVQKILKKNNINNYVYIQPNASVLLRTPGLSTWLYVISYFVDKKIQIVMNTRPEHFKMVDYIKGFVKEKFRNYIYNLSTESKSLQHMMAFINNSKMVIAPDSSSIHIAAGLNKPVYGIYGPFPGKIRMSTYKKAKWIEPDPTKNSICKFKKYHCCYHTSQPCPYNQNNISYCFYNLDHEKMFYDLDEFYKKYFK